MPMRRFLHAALAGVLCVALLLQPGSARAESEAPAPGTRVRLTAPELSDQPLIGTLTALETDAVSLSLDGQTEPTTVPRDAITKWELSRGKHSNRGKGALIGLATGVVVGVTIGALFPMEDFEDSATVGGISFGAIGAGIGALIGWGHKTERWEEIEQKSLRLAVIPVPGGVGLSVQWSFGGRPSPAR